MTRVLVVDDEPSILRSTELLLTDLGFDVVTTREAMDVPDLLREHHPDLLLQDVRMPGLDLEDLLAEIRADPDIAGTPVLLFSASLSLAEIGTRVGAAGILEKPFRPETVLEAVRDALVGTIP